MFGLTHILYLVISFAVSGALIALGKVFIKTERGHNSVVKFFAVLTVLIHISPLWVDYFKDGSATVEPSMILTIYPCNICMWLLVISAFMKREGILYHILSEFACLGGTVCGVIGLVLNENFGNTPTLADYDILKGMLSHSTMVIGCIYLGVSGLVKIRLHNTLSVVTGLLFFIVDGAIINFLYSSFGLDPCNSMYLLEPPFEDMPWLTTPVIGIMALVLIVLLSSLFEKLALHKKWKEIFTFSNLLDFDYGAVDGDPIPAEI